MYRADLPPCLCLVKRFSLTWHPFFVRRQHVSKGSRRIGRLRLADRRGAREQEPPSRQARRGRLSPQPTYAKTIVTATGGMLFFDVDDDKQIVGLDAAQDDAESISRLIC